MSDPAEKSLPAGKDFHNENTELRWASLNDIFSSCLRKVQRNFPAVSINVRCGSLPQLYARPQDLEEVFDRILQMITSGFHDHSFFLNVSCEEENQMRVHAAIPLPADWKLLHTDSILRCKIILSAYGGTLEINRFEDSGCLFLISLPDKIQ